jgi:hypothetical protein
MNKHEQERLRRLIASRAHRFPEGGASLDAIDRELDSIDAEPIHPASLQRILDLAARRRLGAERRRAGIAGPTRGKIPQPRVGAIIPPPEVSAPPAGPLPRPINPSGPRRDPQREGRGARQLPKGQDARGDGPDLDSEENFSSRQA